MVASVEEGDLDAALRNYELFRSSEGSDAELLGRVASIVLVREAGGQVSEIDGGDKPLHGGSIIAANGDIFETARRLVQKA